jgi:hypothetical protein
MDLDGPLGISSHGVVGSNPGKRLFFWLDLFCFAGTEFTGLFSGSCLGFWRKENRKENLQDDDEEKLLLM